MISINYSSRQGRHDLTVQGHACYNPGNDIVCAGVSAITWTLLGFLMNTDAEYTHSTGSGDAAICCERTQQTDTAFQMAVIGYMQIAHAYPNNVTIHMADIDG